MRVLLVSPYGNRVNPYIDLMIAGLTSAGASVTHTRLLTPEHLPGADRPDVIHLHWIEGYDRAIPRLRAVAHLSRLGPVRDLRRWRHLAALLDLLAQFQGSGGRVAYTAHNLDPHESASWPERRALRRVLSLADVVHAHDRSTTAELAARFGRRAGVAVIPHGHYLSAYPNTVSRAEARAALDLPAEAFVYVCLGLLRPYKGFEELVPAFRTLEDGHARLLIAGKAADGRYAERLAALAQGDARIRIEPRFIPPEELQIYFNASDIAALPYRQITTSGAAMLAFSFGAPVLAPAIGAFPDLLSDGRGVLYEPGGLSDALRAAQTRDWAAARRPIIEWVKQFNWEDIGRRLLRAYGE